MGSFSVFRMARHSESIVMLNHVERVVTPQSFFVSATEGLAANTVVTIPTAPQLHGLHPWARFVAFVAKWESDSGEHTSGNEQLCGLRVPRT